jgi:hypothetical protein
MSENVRAIFGTMRGADEEISAPACMERALTYLSEQDQRKFRKEFDNRSGQEEQRQHMFRELLAGVFVARQGFSPRYGPLIRGKTPDWHFKREDEAEFIAEFRNLQSADNIRDEQKRALEGDGVRMWCGWMPDNADRLWQSMLSKAGKYKSLAIQTGSPYVVIVHGLFTACLVPSEVEACILPSEGLFSEYPDMSGVYHMYEKGNCISDPAAGYRFDFYANPIATRPAPWLRSGVLPYRFPARQAQAHGY